MSDDRKTNRSRRGAPRKKRPAATADAAEDRLTGILETVRAIAAAAVPDAIEEKKWRGVPVWSKDGILFTGETYRAVVKLTFARGAALPDPSGLFNASLDGRVRRAIDIRPGDAIDAAALTALIRAAAAANAAARSKAARTGAKPVAPAAPSEKKKAARSRRKPAAPAAEETVVLLAGGNPQIAKGAGESVVRTYIERMPGWKRAVGEEIDRLITEVCPDVRKAVKWNSPLYGAGTDGYFLGFHCLTRAVKVAFFRGAMLRPPPPGTSKSAAVRYLDVRESEPIDADQFRSWVHQAAALPGEKL